jgi:hypothetical protein
MVQRVTTTLVDDMDGSDAAETVSFGVDAARYELDLSAQNAAKLRDALAPWIRAARKAGGKHRPARQASSIIDNRAVRAWAQANGIEVSQRGRIAADVVAQFKAAGN